MGYKNWRTPHDAGSVYADLDAELRFTLDAAASHMNALVDKYCTEEGTFDRSVSEFKGSLCTKISQSNGLSPEAWAGEVVFCNPPYDDILPWAQVSNTRVAKASVLLLPPSIDTEWYDALWVKAPEGKKLVVVTRDTPEYHAILWQDVDRNGVYPNRELRFLRHRIRFLRPKHILADGAYDETDPESVPGDSPRAGNLVVITYAR